MELSLNAYYEYEVLNVIPSLRNKKIKERESLIGRINIEKELSLEEKSINLSLPKFMQETINEENKEVYLFNGNIYFGLYCPNENRLESHFIRGYLIKGIKESKEFAILSFLSSRNNPNYFENFWRFEKMEVEPPFFCVTIF
ncbi:hypothetical protein EOM09_06135 [bacterium]|nr:hypothetical protein [bacterium]